MTTKTCKKCGQSKPATPEFFLRRAKGDPRVTSPCRDCHKAKMSRVNRVNYAANRESEMLRAYRALDRKTGQPNDLTVEWFVENVSSKPCTYCGTTEEPRGADRLDNEKGHTQENCVPCCKTCNKVRNNLFTVGEMLLLGKVIATIRRKRKFARLG